MPVEPHDLEHFALLLDVDGTLLDIAPTPHAVEVPQGLLDALEGIGTRLGGALALVSGRPIADLDFIFAPLRLPAVGGHGAEIRLNAGDNYAPRAVTLNRSLKAQLAAIAARYEGIASEDKGYSFALHYRLAPDFGADVVNDVFRVCKYFPRDSFEILTGKSVIEVKSAGFNKGTAVRELMGYAPFAGRIPIFIGDDTTDEAAFAVVPEFNGLSYSVGRKVMGADGRFNEPADVRRWLGRLVGVPAEVS